MLSVLHFRRRIDAPPVALEVQGVHVRHLMVPADIESWLELRHRAMRDERPIVRPWSKSDFQSEMLDKPWWRPDRSWVATSLDGGQQLVGAVTLAVREGAAGTVPVVHWLLVDPAWRRRGIGRLLMCHLEQAAWDDGWREIELETHAGWASAVAFYQSIGYALVAPRRDPLR